MELPIVKRVAAVALLCAITQSAYSAVVIRGGGEQVSCSTNEQTVSVYGGWASCYASGYGTLQDYVLSTYSPIVWLREDVWEDGYLMTHSCTASLNQIGVDVVTTEECSYTPEVSLSVSPVYYRNGDAWITVTATAESDSADIDTIAWDIDNSSSFSGRTTSGGATRESHEVKLPSSLPATISAEVTVVDDEGNSVVVGGELDVRRRSGGR